MINYTTNLIAGRDFGMQVEPNLPNCPPHSHSYIEIAYTVSGKAIHNLNGIKSPLNAGDYVIVNPGDVHGYEIIGNEPYAVINCIFNAKFLYSSAKENTFAACLINPALNFSFSHLITPPASGVFSNNTPYVQNIFQMLLQEYTNKEYKYRTICRNLMNIIILISGRKLVSISPSTFQLTEYMKDYVSMHYSEDKLLQKMSNELNYSPAYMSAKFKRETGISFKSFLQTVRIDVAVSLLNKTTLSVSEIMSAVGYKDKNHFYNVFRKLKGSTPTQHRPGNKASHTSQDSEK